MVCLCDEATLGGNKPRGFVMVKLEGYFEVVVPGHERQVLGVTVKP